MTRSNWLIGPGNPCDTSPAVTVRRNLVLLGPPGVGKGTQAQLLARRVGPCHLSTGDLFRAASELDPDRRSPAVAEAIATIARGNLASDETVLDLVRERVACLRCPAGFVLDGFPRSVPQAMALDRLLADEGLSLDAAVLFDLPLEPIIARLAGRRVCPGCRRVYHTTANPPLRGNTCDECARALVARDDDRRDVVTVRMQQYEMTTAPLIAYYRERGLLRKIDASGTPGDVFALTGAALGLAAGPPGA